MNVGIQPQAIFVTISAPAVSTSIGNPVARDHVDRDPYTGPYVVTPSTTEQVLSTNGLRMTDNVTINAIPNNYGLITWDGNTLTVS